MINIKDEQPKVGQNVIAVGTWLGEVTGLGESEYMGIGKWTGDYVDIDSCTYFTRIIDITHWEHLPEWP